MTSVGNGGRSPCALTGRGATRSSSAPQGREVDVLLHVYQVITQAVELLLANFGGKQVDLDGAETVYRVRESRAGRRHCPPPSKSEIGGVRESLLNNLSHE